MPRTNPLRKPNVSAHMTIADNAAEGKAESLLRTHVFQAYSVSRYREQQALKDDFPYLLYLTMGDGNVRESHKALDGKILPADDPFWETHYPPWDWGCRCIVESLTAEDAEESGVTSAHEMERYKRRFPAGENTFEFHPGSLAIPMKDLRGDLTDEEWGNFTTRMMEQNVTMPDGQRVSVWEWLEFDGNPVAENGTVKFRPASTMEAAEAVAEMRIGSNSDFAGGTPSLQALNNFNRAFTRAMTRSDVPRLREYGTTANNSVSSYRWHEQEENGRFVSGLGFRFDPRDFADPEASFRDHVSDYKIDYPGHRWFAAPSAKRYLEHVAEHEVGHYLLENSPNRDALKNKLEIAFNRAKRNKSIYKVSDYAKKDADEFFSEIFAMYRLKTHMPDSFTTLVEEVLNDL